MSVTFRCLCGRLVEVRTPSRTAICPACKRTIVPADRRLRWGVALGVMTMIGVVSALAVMRANPPSSSAHVPEPTPATVPSPPKVAPVEVAPVAPPPKAEPLPQPAAPVQPAPVPPGPPRVGLLQPAVPDGRFRVGDTFDQEVIVTRKSAARVLGIEVGQGAEYVITSAFRITKVNADQSVVAEQTVRAAKLIAADADLKETLTTALAQAKGAKFEVKVGADGAITAFTGVADPIRVKAGRDANQQMFRLWSILDADAWKELAGLTFFLPDRPLRRGEKWSRAVAHDWGPLGSWQGKTVFAAAGEQPGKRGIERVEYAHNLSYRPPAAAGGFDLPVRVLKADFRPVVAGGVIAFDPITRRTTAAEELFRVRGSTLVSALGSEVAVEVDEQQRFQLTVVATRELEARPPVDAARK